MTEHLRLHQYFEKAAASEGNVVFLKTKEGEFTYQEIRETAKDFQLTLVRAGVQKADRIVLYSEKNADSIAAMNASSLCESIYVPISILNPPDRAAFIILDTAARFIFCNKESAQHLIQRGIPLTFLHSCSTLQLYEIPQNKKSEITEDDTAFILFTSGSTGTPKGVVISHSAAIAFIDWASDAFSMSGREVIASIAPFNFDLSVFDIYVSAKNKATLVLYSEDETKNAMLMAMRLSDDQITTIYATPTFYSALARYGKMDKYDYPSLKKVLFAGEVFQSENFRELLKHWPDQEYANLYGPTETNVCTFYKVHPEENPTSFPIGKQCPYAKLLLQHDDGSLVKEKNQEGELLVSGTSLFSGYWNDVAKTEQSFYYDENNNRYYKTGDLVYLNEKGELVYVGRKDRMIKKNGFRIEPVEIENVVLQYSGVQNTAVCFSKEKNILVCFIESADTAFEPIKYKQFCQQKLPDFMVPDKFVLLHSLPKTASGKVDTQSLNNLL